MTSQGVSSRNGIYFPDAWSGGLIPVDQVTDEDLARIKRENPPQSVRLMSAGMEAEKALVYRAGDELFFHGEVRTTKGPAVMAESWMAPVLLMTEMSTLFYHAACVDPQMDDVIDTENHRLLETLERDFAGLDCTAWVYELKRPEQPYTDRGPHPYGVGVDRFVKWSDLADSEQAYLRQQLRLHWLNVLNPHLFGINGFMGGPSGARWIASVGHVLTPWGYTIDTQFGLIRDEVAGKLVLHNGVSAEGYFPGVDMEIVDQTLPGGRFALDGGIGIWLQPRDLRHDSCLRRPGGRLHTRVSRRAFAHIDMWGQMSLKSEGWVMGEVELGPGWAGSMGITGHL